MRKRSSNLFGGAIMLLVFAVSGCLVSSPRKRAKLVIKPSASPSALSGTNASFSPPPITKLPVVATDCASLPKTRDEEKAREAREASEFAACDPSKKAELRQRLERINAELPHRRDWDPPAEAWDQVSALMKEGCFYRMRSYGGLNVNDFEKLECKEDGKNSLPALKGWWKSGGYRTLRSQLSAQPPIAYAPTMPRFFARETIRDPRLVPFLCSLADDSCPSPRVQGLLQAWGPYLHRRNQKAEAEQREELRGCPTLSASCLHRARYQETQEARLTTYAECMGGRVPIRDIMSPGKFKIPQGWLFFYRGPNGVSMEYEKKKKKIKESCDYFRAFHVATGVFWEGAYCRQSKEEYGNKVEFIVESASSPQAQKDNRFSIYKRGKVAASYVQDVVFHQRVNRFFDEAPSASITPRPEGLKSFSPPSEPLVGYGCGPGGRNPLLSSKVVELWFSMSEDGLLLEDKDQESLDSYLEESVNEKSSPIAQAINRLNHAVEAAPNLPCFPGRFLLPPWSEANDSEHSLYQAMWTLLQSHQTECP